MNKTIQFVLDDEIYNVLKESYDEYYAYLTDTSKYVNGNVPDILTSKYSINIHAKALLIKALNEEKHFIK